MNIKNNEGYRQCIVPLCKNNSKTTPTKCFFPVPKEEKIRTKWCKLMRRNPAKLSPLSSLFCCEDHFDLEDDTDNYMEYKIKSRLGKPVLLQIKKGIFPHKFECQRSYKKPVKKKVFYKNKQKLVIEALKEKSFQEKNESEVELSLKDENQMTPTIDLSGLEIENITNMVGCSIRKCKSRSTTGGYISFFKFPKDELIAKEWLKHCGTNTTIENGRVCSLHFTLPDYWQLRPKRLKPTAVPTLNIDDIDVDKLLPLLKSEFEKVTTPIVDKKVENEIGSSRTPPFLVVEFVEGAKNSTSIVQPERIELCPKCNVKVKSLSVHICGSKVKHIKEDQILGCGACDEFLPNLKSFHIHIFCMHANNVESMFFPTSSEFFAWKSEMERQTCTNYVGYDRSDTKRIYHCDHIQEVEDKKTAFYCPSIIIVQEFSKGVQVHFYHNHYKHKCLDYVLADKFKKFCITSFLKSSIEYKTLSTLHSDDNDMYLQFKSLMEGIIVDAAKINVTTLNILLGKALEMTSILTNYDEECEEHELNTSQSLTDEQITKALETNLNAKRKSNNKITTPTLKRARLATEDFAHAPKIVNSFSLADKTIEKLDTNEEEKDEAPEKDSKSDDEMDSDERDPYSSAFNDSYKDFVAKNFPLLDNEKRRLSRKRVVKTRMGQFKPNTSPKSDEKLPKKEEILPKSEEKPIVENQRTLRSVRSLTTENSKAMEKLRKVQKLKVEETQKIVEKVVVKPKIVEKVVVKPKILEKVVVKPKILEKVVVKPNIVEKVVVKPKIVEKVVVKPKLVEKVVDKPKSVTKFKVEIPKVVEKQKDMEKPKVVKFEKFKSVDKPKKISKIASPSRLSFEVPIIDPKYEVKEQEGDCNILILKI